MSLHTIWIAAVGFVVPVASTVGDVLLGEPVPGPAVWIGIAVVAAGVAVGMRSRRS